MFADRYVRVVEGSEPMNTIPELKKQRQPQTVFDNTEFVDVWMSCKTVQEVADAFGVTKIVVESKAHRLRSKGVKLPYMQNRLSEVDKLNKLISKHLKGKS